MTPHPSTYRFHTRPFAHQQEAFALSWERPAFAMLMEQGTGKTKVLLDTAAALLETQRIDGLLIIADNGIHRNWITDELPVHWPPRLRQSSLIWQSGKSKSKRWQASFTALLAFRGLAILAMNVDALITRLGAETLQRFFAARKNVLMVVDESSSIKNPTAKRTKAAIHFGQLSAYRRIANGTPAVESPLDVYSQFLFLDPRILGFTSYFTFKHTYAVWIPQHFPGRKRFEMLAKNPDGSPRYINLDELQRKIATASYRKLKDECLDLPPKLYQRRYFELSNEEARLYTQLRETFLLEMSQQDVIPVTLTITRMLRLQQIASGYLPSMGEEPEKPIAMHSSRLMALMALLEEVPRTAPVIIWARFRYDVALICQWLIGQFGPEAVARYDGAVSDEDRARNKTRFQSGAARFFVGNPAAGGKGLTLTQAATMIYYSNSFRLEHRLHSEDRAHRIGQTQRLTIFDLMALDTVDFKVVQALRAKKDLATLVTGDPKGDWI